MLEFFPQHKTSTRKWTEVKFSKYKGKTLPQIVLMDPDWFFWAIEKGVFKTGALKAEAKEIWKKARHIRIPKSDATNWKVEYTRYPGSGKLTDVSVVPASHPRHFGSSETVRSDHFDLSTPWQFADYDKMGSRIMVGAIKSYVFGNSEVRMTRNRCERFFNDDSNFT